MISILATSKTSTRFTLYGVTWPNTIHPAKVEMDMVRMGGRFEYKGDMVGEGLFFHLKRLQELIFLEKVWHKWNILQLEKYCQHRSVAVIGPASSGKTNSAATDVLAEWLCTPEMMTALFCSTTKERLEDRVWGEVKKYFKAAKRHVNWLPGHLIEGRQRIMLDSRHEAVEGRDFRNGLIGVPCKKGGDYVGLGDFIGIKNKKVRLVGDELQLLPKAFIDSMSNLDKNPDFKILGMGNPKDTTDALGVLAEPAPELGGWESGLDQGSVTTSWTTRRPGGCCIQLPGSDSPNLDGTMPIPLITKEQMDRDAVFYGRDSVWFTMFNEGRMPRGQGSRRVMTRQMCYKFGAFNEPNFTDSNRVHIAFLDAAYRGVGGDRCIFGTLEFGGETAVGPGEHPVSAVISQQAGLKRDNQIIALNQLKVVPIIAASNELPEDQIVKFVKEQCTYLNISPTNFYFDSGMRTSLVSAFARQWSAEVNPVDCGGKASERSVSADIRTMCRDYYFNFITELWFNVRMAVETGQFRGMTDDVCWEFSVREWRMVGNNKIQVEPKEDMKLKTGRSPDLADAVAVGIYGAIRRGFRLQKLRSVDGKRGHDWRKEINDKGKAIWRTGELNHKA